LRIKSGEDNLLNFERGNSGKPGKEAGTEKERAFKELLSSSRMARKHSNRAIGLHDDDSDRSSNSEINTSERELGKMGFGTITVE